MKKQKFDFYIYVGVLKYFWGSAFLLQEKLFSSKNRTEVSLGKKLKNDMLPEIEKEHKVLKTAC